MCTTQLLFLVSNFYLNKTINNKESYIKKRLLALKSKKNLLCENEKYRTTQLIEVETIKVLAYCQMSR